MLRTVILSSLSNQTSKAIATINKNEDVELELKLINNEDKLDKNSYAIMYFDKQELICKLYKTDDNKYICSCKMDSLITGQISVAIFSLQNSRAKLSYCGSTSKKDEFKSEMLLRANSLSIELINKETSRLTNLFSSSEEAIEKEIDENINKDCDIYQIESSEAKIQDKTKVAHTDSCENCKYKETFYSINNTQKKSFYSQLEPSIESILSAYPIDSEFSALIKHSKFVKIDYDGDGIYYFLGIIYDENSNIKYIGYAVPGVYASSPPQELTDKASWLPKNQNAPYGEGYWLLLQDSENGQQEKMEDILFL